MRPEWIALAVVVGLIGVGLFLVLRRGGAPEIATPAVGSELASTTPSDVDASAVFSESLVGLVEAGDSLVVGDPRDPGLIMVFGSAEVATTFGEILSRVPTQLATVAVGADALVKAGLAAGEQSGMLVRLTKESTKAVRELKKIRDVDGSVMGVLRGQGGKFKHVVRFKPATGLQTLSSATNILSAVAMQAQLAAIEKALGELVVEVRQVQATLDNQALAKQEGLTRVLSDVYRGAQAVGVLTQAAWDQVAPMAMAVEERVSYSRREFQDLLHDLSAQRGTSARRAWLTKNGPRFVTAVEQLERANQSQVQFAALRLWWLSVTDDPTLAHYQHELEALMEARELNRQELRAQLSLKLEDAEGRWWFDYVHSPVDTIRVKGAARGLSGELLERGILRPIPALRVLPEQEALPAAAEEPDESRG